MGKEIIFTKLGKKIVFPELEGIDETSPTYVEDLEARLNELRDC